MGEIDNGRGLKIGVIGKSKEKKKKKKKRSNGQVPKNRCSEKGSWAYWPGAFIIGYTVRMRWGNGKIRVKLENSMKNKTKQKIKKNKNRRGGGGKRRKIR